MKFHKSLVGLLIVASCVSGRGTVGTNAAKSVADLDHATVFLQTAQSSDSELKKKIGAFRLALKKGILSESDWQLHDDLLKQYIKLKYGLRGTQLTLPAKSRIRVKLPSFCLNAGRAIPNEQEHFRWKKASPDIPYYKELIKQSAYAKNKGDYQSLLWNLQNKTHWEQYPENLKKIILGIDPKAPLKLPSDIKSKATSALSDFIESKLPVVSKAKEVLGSAKGTFQDIENIQRQLEVISSSYPLTQRGDMPELVDGTELFATTQSQGYSYQEVTFYNPTNEEQSLDLTEYYLEPARSDVQRIGITGTSADGDLFADLERVLFEDMLRLGIGFTPGLNDASDLYEFITGKDFITGKWLSLDERLVSGVGLALGSGSAYRFAKRWISAPAQYVTEFSRGMEKVGGTSRTYQRISTINEVKQAAKIAKEFSTKLDSRGVKKLSEALRDAAVKRPDRLDVMISFDRKTIELKVAERDISVYRWHNDNEDAKKLVGRFFTPNKIENKEAARRLLALPPKNKTLYLDKFELKKGSAYFEGRIAPKFGHAGGETQYFIPGALQKTLRVVERIK